MGNDLAGTLVYLIHDIHRSFHKELLHADSRGMNLHQACALAILREHTGMIMKDFAQAMDIAAPTATTLIDRLVKSGWVQRMVDKKNRKLVRIAISPAGKRMLALRQKQAGEMMKQLIKKAIPSGEQQHLLRILQILRTEIRHTCVPKVS